ncbi:uncharacterized protein LOC135362817 isoform X2 [Mirounga angustirostris]|uniref:uncharacterized protein LOC135362817 isoform X2 n=1 Tax=Mirounga angustirostris TaxID=9716 RepID=UPI00313B1C84
MAADGSGWQRMRPDAANGARTPHTHLLRRRTASGKGRAPQSTLGWCWAQPIESAGALCPIRAGGRGSDVHALPALGEHGASRPRRSGSGAVLGPRRAAEGPRGSGRGTARPEESGGAASAVFPASARRGTRILLFLAVPGRMHKDLSLGTQVILAWTSSGSGCVLRGSSISVYCNAGSEHLDRRPQAAGWAVREPECSSSDS